MIEVIAASFLIGLSGAASPGPMTASVLGLGTQRPGPFVAWLVAGHGTLEAIMVAAIAYACEISRIMQRVIGSVPCRVWYHAVPPRRWAVDAGEETRAPLVIGVACTLGNPYWWVWWLTFSVGFLALHPSFTAFYIGHIGAISPGSVSLRSRSHGGRASLDRIIKGWCRRAGLPWYSLGSTSL